MTFEKTGGWIILFCYLERQQRQTTELKADEPGLSGGEDVGGDSEGQGQPLFR